MLSRPVDIPFFLLHQKRTLGIYKVQMFYLLRQKSAIIIDARITKWPFTARARARQIKRAAYLTLCKKKR